MDRKIEPVQSTDTAPPVPATDATLMAPLALDDSQISVSVVAMPESRPRATPTANPSEVVVTLIDVGEAESVTVLFSGSPVLTALMPRNPHHHSSPPSAPEIATVCEPDGAARKMAMYRPSVPFTA